MGVVSLVFTAEAIQVLSDVVQQHRTSRGVLREAATCQTHCSILFIYSILIYMYFGTVQLD